MLLDGIGALYLGLWMRAVLVLEETQAASTGRQQLDLSVLEDSSESAAFEPSYDWHSPKAQHSERLCWQSSQ